MSDGNKPDLSTITCPHRGTPVAVTDHQVRELDYRYIKRRLDELGRDVDARLVELREEMADKLQMPALTDWPPAGEGRVSRLARHQRTGSRLDPIVRNPIIRGCCKSPRKFLIKTPDPPKTKGGTGAVAPRGP